MEDFRVDSAAPNPVLRVLIFSDMRFLRCALTEMLAHEISVFIVGVATDLREVQLICQEHDPDLILFDLGLPNGSAAIRELRKSVRGYRDLR
jgi:DNA-binding NarL/FixJ family response regulator